jgi:glucose-6-phosphate 1-epimerase
MFICRCAGYGCFSLFFLQFSNLGVTEKHGFARNRLWAVDSSPSLLPSSSEDKAVVDLILKPTEEDLKSWNHGYLFSKL